MKPLDDMISRQEYFVVARLFLTYLMRQWEVTCPDNCQVLSLFSEDVIAFATNTELSFFGNKRQPIHILEDRIDFKLLNFIREKSILRRDSKSFVRRTLYQNFQIRRSEILLPQGQPYTRKRCKIVLGRVMYV